MLTMPAIRPRRSVVRRVLRSARPVRRQSPGLGAARHGLARTDIGRSSRGTRASPARLGVDQQARLICSGLSLACNRFCTCSRSLSLRASIRAFGRRELGRPGPEPRWLDSRTCGARSRGQLPADRRRRPAESDRDRSHSLTGRATAGDLLAFVEREPAHGDRLRRRREIPGITPPTWRNHRHATVIDTPAQEAASATTIPDRIAAQNSRCTATGIAGRPPTLTQHLRHRGVALTR